MKTAVITGVSGGMGLATAKRLVHEGYRVFGLDIHRPAGLTGFGIPGSKRGGFSPALHNKTKAGRKESPALHFIQTDLTDSKSVSKAFRIVKKMAGKVDCLIHMAGIYDLNSLVEMTENEFLRIFNINLFALYRVNKIFLPLLEKGSRILMTSSELAPLDPLPFTGIYGITKTAVERYAFSLRMELQLLGIRVIVLRPGAVDTGLLNVSTKRLDDFCKNTKLYPTNAERFRRIVDRVEARKIRTEAIADLVAEAVSAKHPKFVYQINRNPLLILLNRLPDGMQNRIIRGILRS